ncbi:conserved hypothetical protein, partial [delta proteobacterium NaphS2]
MGLQPVPQFTVCRIENVFANVTQKMEVTDVIRYSGEHLFDRFADALPHVMYAGSGCSVASLMS